MPTYVSVRVKTFANYCPNKVGVSILVDIRTRRVERRGKNLGGGGVEGDCLRRADRRTYTVELQIPGVRVCEARVLIYEVVVFNANIAFEIYLEVHLWVYRDSCVAA